MAVNSPDDDNTSYLQAAADGYVEQYSLAAHTIPSGSKVNSVSVHSRTRRLSGSGNTHSVHLVLGGSSSVSATHVGATSWVSFTDLLARPGGGSWTLSDLSTLEVGIKRVGSIIVRCTSLWLIVDYTPPKAAMFLLFP